MRHLSLEGAAKNNQGSSLIETALVMPVLVLMLCFAIDIGYFFIVAANLVSSSRNAVLYSGQGFVSPAQTQLPSPGSAGSLADTAGAAGLAGGDLSGLASMSSETFVEVTYRYQLTPWCQLQPDFEVCSKEIGITHTSNGYITNCSTFPSGALTFTPDQDPESNNGMLTQRVDVVYTVAPPIPVNFFTFTMPPLTVHWKAEMRAVD